MIVIVIVIVIMIINMNVRLTVEAPKDGARYHEEESEDIAWRVYGRRGEDEFGLNDKDDSAE